MKRLRGKIITKINNRIIITVLLILIQIAFMVSGVYIFADYSRGISAALAVLSFLMSLYIIRRDDSSSYKMIWLLVMGAFPILGGLMYIFMGNKRPAKKLREKIDRQIKEEAVWLGKDSDIISHMDKRSGLLSAYISKYGGYPVCENTEAEYFPCGEEMFEVMLSELEKAERSIFMEYFIIGYGEMWSAVLKILEKKAKNGVDVRIIYDDMGCMGLLPSDYPAHLAKKGIKVIPFNRFVPVVSAVMNHRDHRKILDIDGNTAFTGGINISDEYINKEERFGYWKDTALMIKGDGVMNFTVMFAQMWNALSPDKIDCEKCRPTYMPNSRMKGFFQPYSDSPLDNEQLGENVYIDILNQAEDYVYIFTPYLVIDDRMIAALGLAAKRGVDVRIVTPGIPDKKPIFRVTRSYYQVLIEEGVRIYEYTPGFLHAKSYVSDDKRAVVGSINMDFRSLYLHFECGVFMSSNDEDKPLPAVMALKEDCLRVFEQSKEIMPDESRWFSRSLIDAILRALGPLI